ncbi:hypothetical protein BDZ97DRAFT_1758796 [Flammula alnicola]|nr:hypothetical protein BDZ97DRAFT_1758796 [Flammula alnicola]
MIFCLTRPIPLVPALQCLACASRSLGESDKEILCTFATTSACEGDGELGNTFGCQSTVECKAYLCFLLQFQNGQFAPTTIKTKRRAVTMDKTCSGDGDTGALIATILRWGREASAGEHGDVFSDGGSGGELEEENIETNHGLMEGSGKVEARQ